MTAPIQQTRCSHAVTGWGQIRDNWAARTRGTRARGELRHVTCQCQCQSRAIDGYPEICLCSDSALGTRHGGAEVRETTKRSVAQCLVALAALASKWTLSAHCTPALHCTANGQVANYILNSSSLTSVYVYIIHVYIDIQNRPQDTRPERKTLFTNCGYFYCFASKILVILQTDNIQ